MLVHQRVTVISATSGRKRWSSWSGWSLETEQKMGGFSLFEAKTKGNVSMNLVRGFTSLPKHLGQMDGVPTWDGTWWNRIYLGVKTLLPWWTPRWHIPGYLWPHLWPLQPGQGQAEMFYGCAMTLLPFLPSGERLHSNGKIHHAINGKIHYKWPFSIAMLVHQRVHLKKSGSWFP